MKFSEAETALIGGRQCLVLATHNAGKVQEMDRLFKTLGLKVLGAGDLGLDSPEETGTTFTQNALLKASAAANVSGLWALADDSGLEVEALSGKPGVDTAHYGGWEKLLDVMAHVPDEQRGARFVCVLALIRNGFPPVYFEGVCEGNIALHAKGCQGFGYDPVFIPEGFDRTFAEMTQDEKSAISHRGRAVDKFATWAKAEMAQNS